MDYSMVVETLWRISWQVAAVAVVVWVVTRLTRRAPAGWRYALWLVVVVKFFVPPFAYFPSELAFWQSAEPARPIPAITSPAPYPSGAAMPIEAPHSTTSAPRADLAAAGNEAGSVNFAAVIWIAGACTMASILALRFVRQVKLVRTSSPASQDVTDLLEESSESLRMRRLPEVRLSEHAPTPMVMGVLRPVVLLPTALPDSCSASDLKAMLLHELAHVKRWDMAAVWLHQVARVLFFFHPAAWLAGRELARERELACDEMVLSNTGIAPKEYAAGYVSALKLASASPAVSTSLGMAEPFEVEKRRLNMILRSAVPKLSGRWKLALTAAVVIALPTFIGVSSVFSSKSPADTAARLPAAATDEELLRIVREGCGKAVSRIKSGKGSVTKYSLHTKKDGSGSTETETTYNIAFSGEKYKALVQTKFLEDQSRVGYPGEVLTAPGSVSTHVVAYDGQQQISLSSDRRRAVISDQTAGKEYVPLRCIVENETQGRGATTIIPRYGFVPESALFANRSCGMGGGYEGGPYENEVHVVGREEVDGEECVVVEKTVKLRGPAGDKSAHWHRYWVNPAKGFAVPRQETWGRGGGNEKRLVSQTTTELRDYGDGLWGPAKATQEEYRINSETGKRYRAWHRVVTYGADFQLNVPVSEEDVRLPPGTKVYDDASQSWHTLP